MPTLRVGQTPSTLVGVHEPSVIEWGWVNVTSSDSGRVQDENDTLYTMRTSRKVRLKLGWTLPSADETAGVLQAFSSEYVYLEYFDPYEGDIAVKEFAVGDMSAPYKYYDIEGAGTKFASLSFEVTER